MVLSHLRWPKQSRLCYKTQALSKQCHDIVNSSCWILLNSAEYMFSPYLISNSFFDNLDRIIDPKYVPTVKDVLMSRTKTTGVSEMEFNVGKTHFRLCIVIPSFLKISGWWMSAAKEVNVRNGCTASKTLQQCSLW